MKIALLGYGKMGKEIEIAGNERGHQIVLKINSENFNQLNKGSLQTADVAIEFSRPEIAVDNAKLCIDAHIPVIIGTTGWYEHKTVLEQYCIQNNGTAIYASNFSTGVNVFFIINEILSRLMSPMKYDAWIEEVHHIHKKDIPSGTAITLANDILKYNKQYSGWAINDEAGKLPIYAQRIDEVTGFHSVSFRNEVDTIEITHNAFSRKGFALGAIKAAEMALTKKGFYEYKNLLIEQP
ncbi:MAG: 4-hydroxy-tetrahydrodipicolinate reductase [Bacteroidetes bacterium]|nr:4-hydroxy-tetrahydrodipicolinate reductase [Bacteroidota bacterium]MBX7238582.1 4-hydroxy-tetrahydrodipicolinate reductase [Bacteroidia bacterium]MCC7514924.1 4-hydroxy-tetrahydrodipicolinate reductase [Bacteroidia bacterium]MCW5918275.1 4-hydroxy-tetrahydrodipicolinate reductase [Bacteroidota bacterium]HCI58363.1 4-hydroxy-tetrahydrodipicolinate reductase [Bacteroidota bacterium]